MSFKPQLACDAKDLSKLKFPLLMLTKIDGVRLLNVDGRAVGRSLKQYKNKAMTAYFSRPELAGLDGELVYNDEITSESLCRDTTSVVNTIKGDCDVVWNCFDYLTEDTKHLPYKERHQKMVALVTQLNDPKIKFIGYETATVLKQLSNGTLIIWRWAMRGLSCGVYMAFTRMDAARRKSRLTCGLNHSLTKSVLS